METNAMMVAWKLVCVLVDSMKNEVGGFLMCVRGVSEFLKSQKTTNFVIKGTKGASGKGDAALKQLKLLPKQYDPFILAKCRRKRMTTAPGSDTIAPALVSSC
jgi:hypothetical protein